mgnify:CR=1 FL=1
MIGVRERGAGAETCSVCGAGLEERRIIYTQMRTGKLHVFADVPALVCVQCGEEYLSPETVDAVQKAFTEREATETIEVPLYRFERARA